MITLAYFTNRREPHFEWFCNTLSRELKANPGVEVDMLVIDYHAEDPDRREAFQHVFSTLTGRSSIRVVEPKPCAVQGRYRKTSANYFAASNARNTAFALCRTNYIACVDDLSALNPGWLGQVLHAEQHKYVVLGAYKKVLELRVGNDGWISYTPFPPGVDSRWAQGSDNGIVRAGGSWMFGCSFGLPITAAEKVNGFDELCDMVGMEDVEFGIRLERAGCELYYNRNMLTYESEEMHSAPGNEKFIRESVPHKSGVNSDWYIYNTVVKTHKTWTEGNDFTLSDMRKSVFAGNPFPMPTKTIDWRTGQPFK